MALALSSCGKGNGNSGNLINGNDPQTFYSQMAYQKTSSGTSDSSRYLAPVDGSVRIVQKLQAGINMYEDPALFLTGTPHQYTLVSDLSVGCNNGQGVVKYRIDHKVLTGFWSVDGASRITLTPYAVGSGGTVGGNSAVNLQFSKDIHSDVMATKVGGVVTQLLYRDMPTSKDDITSAGYKYDFQSAVSALKGSGACK